MAAQRKLAAILSADVAGYSRLMADDEAATVAALHEAQDLFRAKIQTHQGRVIDTAGDSVLAEFVSPVEAVSAAAEIQRELKVRNSVLPERRRMVFRIGVNLGDVIEEGENLYGDGVNVAARLQALAEPGGICISGTAFDQVEGKLPLSFKFTGEQQVKNISKPVRVYQLVTGVESTKQRLTLGRRKPAVIVGVALALAVAITAGIIWFAQTPTSKHQTADSALAMPMGPAIAVLPFTNMSGDPNEAYFSDGLTEDIITELARVRELHVLARNTTFQYRGHAVDVRSVGKKLGVQYVLEGSARKLNQQIRITVQLVDVDTGSHIWAEKYDRELKNIFVVQDDITGKVIATIAGGVGSVLQTAGNAVANRKPPRELKAYDLVLRARSTYYYERDSYSKAKTFLEQAIELDPTYAYARQEYAWLMLLGFIFRFEPAERPPKEIKVHAIKAVELDQADARAHRTAAFGYFFDRQLDLFEREATIAFELAPYNAEIFAQLGAVITFTGQWERGIALVDKATSLNPISAAGWSHAAYFYNFYRRGEYQKAIDVIRQHPAQGICETIHKYVSTYGHLGQPEKANEYWSRCLAVEPNFAPERVSQLFEIWNQPQSLRRRYMEGFAKAGLPCKTPNCELQ